MFIFTSVMHACMHVMYDVHAHVHTSLFPPWWGILLNVYVAYLTAQSSIAIQNCEHTHILPYMP